MKGLEKPKHIIPIESSSQIEWDGTRIRSGTWTGPFAHVLWFRPLETPVDETFAPYYQRAMSGDLGALVEFYRECSPSLGTAFFECIGYLAAIGGPPEKKTVQKILAINEMGGPAQTTAAKLKSAQAWIKCLGPVARGAKKWISDQRRAVDQAGLCPLTREKLWEKYLGEKLDRKSEKHFDVLLNDFDFHWNMPLGQDPCDTFTEEDLHQTGGPRPRGRHILRHIVAEYLARGIVPRTLFFELAKSKSSVPTSIAVRRFAGTLANISESRLSRKTLRKK